MLPLLPSLIVKPLALTVLLALPTFLSLKASVAATLTTSPVASVPTVAEPVAERPPSYVLLSVGAVTVSGAWVISTLWVPPLKL